MSGAIERRSLIKMLIDEASDVDLVCYLARSGGGAALRDLLECVCDAEALPIDDLLYNVDVLRRKKSEAYLCPMRRVFQRLMRSDAVPVISNMSNEEVFIPAQRLH
jgi:hypothetical protein